MGGIGKAQTKFYLHCWRRIQTSLAFLHVPIPIALRPSHSSLFLAYNQHDIFPSKYIAFVSSIYPPNVNLASLEEMEGESKSLKNRRHQENMKPSRHIQCQT